MPNGSPREKKRRPWTGVVKAVDRFLASDMRNAPRWRRFTVHYLRVLIFVSRPEVLTRLRLRAQALSFQTVFAIVPLFAVFFVIFKGFGGMDAVQGRLEKLIVENLAGGSELSAQVTNYIQHAVANVSGKTLGVVSIVLLIYSVLGLMQNIEDSFNDIFGVKKGRAWDIRIVLYWTALTLGPLLIGASLALTAFLQNDAVLGIVKSFGFISAALIQMTPLVVTWIAFGALYLVVPNSRVSFKAAAAAAVVAGSAWSAAKFGYAIYAKKSVTTLSIYGTMAALPLFFFWLYVSWIIVLFGAQVAFAFQNAATYREEDDAQRANPLARERAAVRLYIEIARDFFDGRPSTNPDYAAAALGLPRRLLERIVQALKEGGFLRTVDGEAGLIPAKDLGQVTISDLLTHLRSGVGTSPQLADDDVLHFIDDVFGALAREQHRITGDLDFRTLAQKFAAVRRPASEDPVELAVAAEATAKVD
ncbi:MAG: YhjD/YihY/BrkB family envelope integrity protein [Myxococcota bacterium]